ncbi:MAG: hypothetical protein IKR76_00675 [Ruminococcus sp.]|nr:hypothetical protein [Ruminococcus sp.]
MAFLLYKSIILQKTPGTEPGRLLLTLSLNYDFFLTTTAIIMITTTAAPAIPAIRPILLESSDLELSSAVEAAVSALEESAALDSATESSALLSSTEEASSSLDASSPPAASIVPLP